MRLPAFFLALLLPALAAAADLQVPTAIDEVVVHPGAARITRQGKIQVPAGRVRLLLEELTPQLQDDSIRVSASGRARARLLGVSVERQPLAQSTSPAVRDAEEAVRALEFRDRTLQDRIESANQQKAFLNALRAAWAKERSEGLATRPVDPREWARMVETLGAQYNAVAASIRATERERQALGEELQAARQRLELVRAQGNRSFKRVVVDLHVDRQGPLDVALTYQVQGAVWKPAWDARLASDRGLLELGLHAEVQQRTGEAWEGVRLAVSSARLDTRIDMPALPPLYLTLEEQQRHRSAPPPGTGLGLGGLGTRGGRDKREQADAFVLEEAVVLDGMLATTWTVPERVSIPSTGEPRKSFLATHPLQVALQRSSAPARESRAFLTGKAVNESGLPLPAGILELFVDGTYLGRTSIRDVPTGDELELAFGPDPRVSVERTVLERKRDEYGLLSRRERLRYAVRNRVKNHRSEAVEVAILEQLPVSRDASIEVALQDGTSLGSVEEKDKPGVRRWVVRLEPGEEQLVEIRYEVSWPRGTPVHNLP